MPGETAIRIKDIGTVVEGVEFQQYGLVGLVKPIMELKPASGDLYGVMVVDGFGLAIGSHQTKRVLMIEAKTLLSLALEAGVDEPSRLIILPGEAEVSRG